MMLSLISHHFIVNSGITDLYNMSDISANMIFAQIFGMWGKTAINIFTLITGYFMVRSDLTVKKIFKLITTAIFYVYGFYFFFLIIGYETFSIKAMVKVILFIPLEAGKLYTGSMIMMLLFIPFVNILIRGLSKRKFQQLLMLLLFYFSALSTFLRNDNFDFVFWMLTVYMIGGYIRLYPGKWDNKKTGLLSTIISILTMVSSIICIDFIGVKIGFEEYYYFLQDANKILAVMAAFSIFILFKNLNMKNYNWINRVASATFGVLLFHANTAVMRRFLWVDVFRNAEYYMKKDFILYACSVVVLVYVIAVVIELLRIRFVEQPLLNYLGQFDWFSKRF